MGKPNFFIIGEPKSGTTILYNYLYYHEDIFMSERKELHFFDEDIRVVNQQTIPYIDSEQIYLSYFDNAENEKIVGEATPSYARSEKAAENIYNFNKDSFLLYIIKEPVSKIISTYGHNLFRGKKVKKDFLEEIYSDKEFYIDFLMKYSQHLRRYLDYFPKEQIKVLIYEEFKKDNQRTINEITDFLGIDRMEITPFYRNKTLKPRSQFLRQIVRKVLPRNFRRVVGYYFWWILYSDTSPTNLTKKEKTKLMKQFKPEVEELNKLLYEYELIDKNMDLVKYWGYDKV